MGFRRVVGAVLAGLLLSGVSLATPTAAGRTSERPRDVVGGTEEERSGAAELPAELAAERTRFAKVLMQLEGMRGEMDAMRMGKARSDERIAMAPRTDAPHVAGNR